MKILLTAFDPFGGENVNPALEAVMKVSDVISGARIVKVTVPTVFYKSIDVVTDAVKRERPDAVLCVGQAGGRSALTPERIAVNLDDAQIPDNKGNHPVDRTIFPDGAPAYFSTLPIKEMVSAMRAAGVPADISNSAGTFVCNHLMYGLLYTLERKYPGVRGGFMHVPYSPEQVSKKSSPAPSMETETVVRGIEAAIKAVVTAGGNP